MPATSVAWKKIYPLKKRSILSLIFRFFFLQGLDDEKFDGAVHASRQNIGTQSTKMRNS